MKILEIPFVKTVGIVKNDEHGRLELPMQSNVQNHLQTIHASAQFTLAETASGEVLLSIFPELAGKIIPVLRESKIKFKNPAKNNISAYPFVSEESQVKFNKVFSKKGRALILVVVEVRDGDVVTCVGTFHWFIQSTIANQ